MESHLVACFGRNCQRFSFISKSLYHNHHIINLQPSLHNMKRNENYLAGSARGVASASQLVVSLGSRVHAALASVQACSLAISAAAEAASQALPIIIMKTWRLWYFTPVLFPDSFVLKPEKKKAPPLQKRSENVELRRRVLN